MTTYKVWIGPAILFATIFAGGIWWKHTVWVECRSNGHSFVYCMLLTFPE